jgi:hypothetical protein
VYVANEVPAKYLKTVKDLGLVEEGEQIKFLYSDAMTDIKEGVYVVTDRKVATYVSGAAQPLTKVAFTDIAEVEMDDGSGMFEDSSITLTLKDDSVVSFPLSTESKRDKQVLEAIRKAVQSNKSATRPHSATKKV